MDISAVDVVLSRLNAKCKVSDSLVQEARIQFASAKAELAATDSQHRQPAISRLFDEWPKSDTMPIEQFNAVKRFVMYAEKQQAVR